MFFVLLFTKLNVLVFFCRQARQQDAGKAPTASFARAPIVNKPQSQAFQSIMYQNDLDTEKELEQSYVDFINFQNYLDQEIDVSKGVVTNSTEGVGSDQNHQVLEIDVTNSDPQAVEKTTIVESNRNHQVLKIIISGSQAEVPHKTRHEALNIPAILELPKHLQNRPLTIRNRGDHLYVTPNTRAETLKFYTLCMLFALIIFVSLYVFETLIFIN